MKRHVRFGLIGLVVAVGGALAIVGADVLAQDDQDRKHKIVVVQTGDEAGGGYLGVQIVEETEHPEGGARVEGVVDDSPADAAGLEEGDIIVGFGGSRIRGPQALTQKIHGSKPGETVEIEILRDGQRQTVTAEVGERPRVTGYGWHVGEGEGPHVFEWDEEGLEDHTGKLMERLKELKIPDLELHGFSVFPGSKPKLGVQLVDTTPELRVHLGGKEDAGVLVGKVMKGMPAERAGVQVGDLIVAVDGEEVESAGDLIAALADKDGKTLSVEVVRDRKLKTLSVAIPPREVEEEEDEITGPRAWRLDRDRIEQARAQAAEARRQIAEARREMRRALQQREAWGAV